MVKKRKNKLLLWAKTKSREYLPTVATALFVVLLSKTVWLFAVIPTASMEPALPAPCFVFSSRMAYWTKTPQRGDIVLFTRADGKKKIYAKRVIGMPGDIVEIIQGETFVNGKRLEEVYLAEMSDAAEKLYFAVPEGSYFMMGDNRRHSVDSRYWEEHFVPAENILSRVLPEWTIPISTGKKKTA